MHYFGTVIWWHISKFQFCVVEVWERNFVRNFPPLGFGSFHLFFARSPQSWTWREAEKMDGWDPFFFHRFISYTESQLTFRWLSGDKLQGCTVRFLISWTGIWSLTYCWWLKSCTTWDVWNPINNGKNYLSTGAGFKPSTVVLFNTS